MTKPAPRVKGLPKRHAWHPSDYERADVMALKALAAGDANDVQQKRALRFIVEDLAGAYDLEFRPGGEDGRRETDFAAGKRFVGLQVVKLVNLPAELIPKQPT